MEELKKGSQCYKIAKHLDRGHKITSLQALNKFNCLSLAQRIKDLRDYGMMIADEWVTVKGSNKRIKRYYKAA